MSTRTLRILVIEDNPTLRKYLCLLLQEEGYTTVAAGTGAEALHAAGEQQFDLVFTDMNLPDAKGPQFVAELRKHFPPEALVAMSGDSFVARAPEIVAVGVRRFLTKPVEPEVFLRIAREVAEGQPVPAEPAPATTAGSKPWDPAVTRALQARYGALLETAPDAMLIADHAGRIVLGNSHLARLFGYAREALLGQPVEVLVPDRFRGRHPQHRAQYAHDPRRRPMGAALDLLGRRHDGSEFAVEISLNPLESEEGPLVIAAIRDATERRRLEERRREADEMARRQAQDASRLKSEFLANMSHELRTPLNAIIGFTQLLLKGRPGPLTPTQAEYLGDILGSSSHLLQIINDVLDLAKVEAGRLEFRPEPVDLDALATEVRDRLRALADERRIRVEMDLAPGLGPVTVDPGRVKQVLLNFLSNALKFTDEGGRVVIRTRPEGETAFRFEVEDDGIGIRPEDLPRLFMEFQQLDAGPGKRHGGTGLGLALSRRIVEGQGGRVTVQSAPGKGSVFAAVLPRVPQGQVPDVAEGRAPEAPGAATTPLARRVLAVDDNPVNLKLLRAVLTGEGYEVETASSAEEATRALATHPPALIVMDLQLPGMSGFELTGRLKQDPATRDIPILALTAYAMKGDDEKAKLAGCDAYMSKPFDTAELLATIARLLPAG